MHLHKKSFSFFFFPSGTCLSVIAKLIWLEHVSKQDFKRVCFHSDPNDRLRPEQMRFIRPQLFFTSVNWLTCPDEAPLSQQCEWHKADLIWEWRHEFHPVWIHLKRTNDGLSGFVTLAHTLPSIHASSARWVGLIYHMKATTWKKRINKKN